MQAERQAAMLLLEMEMKVLIEVEGFPALMMSGLRSAIFCLLAEGAAYTLGALIDLSSIRGLCLQHKICRAQSSDLLYYRYDYLILRSTSQEGVPFS